MAGPAAGLPVAEQFYNRVRIIHAPAPGSATRVLQRRPKPRVGREIRIGREVGTRSARGERARAPFDALHRPIFADQVEPAGEGLLVDDDLDHVTVEDLANRAASE